MKKSSSNKPFSLLSLILVILIFAGIIFGFTYYIGSSNNNITSFEVQFSPDNGLNIKIDKEKEAPIK